MENWPGATVGVAYGLTGVSFFIITLRNALRRLKHEDQLLDDWLMLGSAVFYALCTATNPIAVGYGLSIWLSCTIWSGSSISMAPMLELSKFEGWCPMKSTMANSKQLLDMPRTNSAQLCLDLYMFSSVDSSTLPSSGPSRPAWSSSILA